MGGRVKHADITSINIDDTYFEIHGPTIRGLSHITVRDVMESMQLSLPTESNVRLVVVEDQDVSVNNPPKTYSLDKPIHLAADENFLYVWVKDRWKRVPLSEF